MLVVSLCKPVIYKLKILGGGNLNIINQWGNHKKGGVDQILKFQWGGAKGGGGMISDSNLVGRILEETMPIQGKLFKSDEKCFLFYVLFSFLRS